MLIDGKFSDAHGRNCHKTTSGQILTQNLKPPWAVSYSTTNFAGAYYKIYACFVRKNGFRNAKFSEFGDLWGWGVHFLTKPPKGTSSPDFTRFEPSSVQIRSRVFAPGVCTKKGTLQKVTERLLFTYLGGIPNPTKFNQNWHTRSGCRRNQSHQD